MLAVSPLRGSQYGDERDGNADAFSMLDDFSDDTFLEGINFDDICLGFDVDGDALPDLEVDPADIFAEFTVVGGEEEEEDEEDAGMTAETAPAPEGATGLDDGSGAQDRVSLDDNKNKGHPTKEHSIAATSSETASSSSGSGGRGQPSVSAAGRTTVKSSQGKKKAKVDWTPELHRRFVQAVEVLGVDKAVPSRILEIMGIDCLTRHNIASHLQKYRSHRKHALAREAEAASCWSQRRPQTYAPAAKKDAVPWLAPPTIGFPHPPPVPPPPAPPVQHFRPLHVWGHPTGADLKPLVRAWPRHGLLPAPQGPPAVRPPPWAPPHPPGHPPPEASYWHQFHYQRGAREGWIPHSMTQGTPCFPHPMPTAMQRFPAVPVPVPPAAGILSHHLYRPVLPPTAAAASKQAGCQLQLDAHPTSESIDAAIEDALRKPWLPMPLGLKPPSVDSVLVELQKQGVAKVPPSCTTS